jgi:hypothetical protein
MFDINLGSIDSARRVAAIDATLAAARAHERQLVEARTSIAAELAEAEKVAAEDDDRRPSTRERLRDLREALAQIDRGLTADEGARPDLASFVGKPGLISTRATIERLTAERPEWIALRDSDSLGTRPFRLREGFRHIVDGRRLKPGEIVHLTVRAARAFADKFEAVERDAPATESEPAEAVPATV